MCFSPQQTCLTQLLNENSHLPHSKRTKHRTAIAWYSWTYGTLARDHYVTDLEYPRNFCRLWVGGRIE